MSSQPPSFENYTTLSTEERQALSVEENLELDLFEQAIRAGDVGPISKAAQEWLNHFATKSAKTPAPDTPALRPDLTTPEERKARVEYLLKLRAAAKQAAFDRKAASKARRMKDKSGDVA
ncbi:hypothetical protein C8R45DRAFT_1096524 [Mycena sanguinolenta]|nr:hypothetical protein C8R45DRAFT_1096524 [Mycena sanguinolenta]